MMEADVEIVMAWTYLTASADVGFSEPVASPLSPLTAMCSFPLAGHPERSLASYSRYTFPEISMSTALTTVQTIYAAFGRGDIPAILDTLDADVQWEPWSDNRAQAADVPWMRRRCRD